MDTYADAATVWAKKETLYIGSEPGDTLIPKYSLLGKRAKYFWGDSVEPEQALQLIWQIGDLHVEKVARLLGQNS